MRRYYSLPLVVGIATGVMLYGMHWFLILPSDFYKVYGEKFQVPLFSGFLTISGFLLSLATFIIVRMHDSVYMDEDYIKTRVATNLRIDPDYSPTKPLKELSHFLVFCVITTLAASFSQFTLGNLGVKWLDITCISLAAGAAVSVISAGFLIRRNIDSWIAEADKKAKKILEKEESATES